MFQLPRECRVFKAVNPAVQWGWLENFANQTNYLLEMLVWQNATPPTKAKLAAHKRLKPKPFVPDFLKPEVEASELNNGSEKHTVDDIRNILSMPRG